MSGTRLEALELCYGLWKCLGRRPILGKEARGAKGEA